MTSDKTVRIVLVDDHRIMREGLRLLIEKQPDMTVVGEAADAKTAVERTIECAPDLVVMDIHLPDGNGIEAARQILAALPATRIVILSGHPDPVFVDQALGIGVSGYVLKENASEDLIRAIHTVLDDKIYLCPEMTTAVILDYRRDLAKIAEAPKPVLTPRERQLLKLIAAGQRNKEIALQLKVSDKSIEVYRSRLMAKLNCHSPAELVRYAIREGIAAP